MRYAVISDIHGNLPALNAVIDDAKRNFIDEYVFVGDYYCDLAYPNEVVNTIKNIKGAHVIKGNKEKYLDVLLNSDQSEWVYEQFAPLYWNYRELDDDNLQYLIGLPEDKKIQPPNSNHKMHLFHAPAFLFKSTNMDLLSSSKYVERMIQENFSHEEYLCYVQKILSSDDKIVKILDGLDTDIVIFGHSHIQWHAEIDTKVIINPGSCGLPLDYDKRAAYTILELNENAINILERRIPYNISDTICYTMKSELYINAKTWCDIIFHQLNLAKEEITFFFRHVESIAKKKNDYSRPYSTTVWKEAANSWKSN
ncbi:metallophosphoesterase family protein [Clostridium tagluense]|uniref:Serine/threonine protein phosphatase n=1 Tax=Clostridium tagluense TaxID=360422 RepID=A0A401UM07_9CLOT|nr:metallophosphoesterase family protein [Clostridium tagluense]GCD10569.1 serine/threonine protein phosphatase [Clostridium tagluense]